MVRRSIRAWLLTLVAFTIAIPAFGATATWTFNASTNTWGKVRRTQTTGDSTYGWLHADATGSHAGYIQQVVAVYSRKLLQADNLAPEASFNGVTTIRRGFFEVPLASFGGAGAITNSSGIKSATLGLTIASVSGTPNSYLCSGSGTTTAASDSAVFNSINIGNIWCDTAITTTGVKSLALNGDGIDALKDAIGNELNTWLVGLALLDETTAGTCVINPAAAITLTVTWWDGSSYTYTKTARAGATENTAGGAAPDVKDYFVFTPSDSISAGATITAISFAVPISAISGSPVVNLSVASPDSYTSGSAQGIYAGEALDGNPESTTYALSVGSNALAISSNFDGSLGVIQGAFDGTASVMVWVVNNGSGDWTATWNAAVDAVLTVTYTPAASGPSANATNVIVASVYSTQASFRWTASVDGTTTGYTLWTAPSSGLTTNNLSGKTVANTTYTANSSTLSDGNTWTCRYNGSAVYCTASTGLSAATGYRVKVCAYNGSAGTEQYNDADATGNRPTDWTTTSYAKPTTQALLHTPARLWR